MADLGVMMPFIFGTEFMMPLLDQKWLEPASRMVSKEPPEKPWASAFLTGLALTRPGALRPGICRAGWRQQSQQSRVSLQCWAPSDPGGDRTSRGDLKRPDRQARSRPAEAGAPSSHSQQQGRQARQPMPGGHGGKKPAPP